MAVSGSGGGAHLEGTEVLAVSGVGIEGTLAPRDSDGLSRGLVREVVGGPARDDAAGVSDPPALGDGSAADLGASGESLAEGVGLAAGFGSALNGLGARGKSGDALAVLGGYGRCGEGRSGSRKQCCEYRYDCRRLL